MRRMLGLRPLPGVLRLRRADGQAQELSQVPVHEQRRLLHLPDGLVLLQRPVQQTHCRRPARLERQRRDATPGRR